MDWAGKSHPLETLMEWGAPAVLAIAVAWASLAAGLPLAAITAGGVVALLAGTIAMRTAGRTHQPRNAAFTPAEYEPDGDAGELLLDDPLVDVEADSRVVRLFEQDDPTPGELVLRISDYLSEQGKPPVTAEPSIDHHPVDASEALHAALANIRATLR